MKNNLTSLFANRNFIRTFIGLDFTNSQKKFIYSQKSAISSKLDDKIIWESAEKYHITLKFIGKTDINLLNQIINILKTASCKFNKFTCEIGLNFGTFPNMIHPKILWLGYKDEKNCAALISNYFNIELEKCGIASENKNFCPHITLGKINKNFNLNLSEIETIKNSQPEKMIVEINKITLFQSVDSKYKKILESMIS